MHCIIKLHNITANLFDIWRVLDFCLPSNIHIFHKIITFTERRIITLIFCNYKIHFPTINKKVSFCDLFFLISSHPLNKEKLEYNLLVFSSSCARNILSFWRYIGLLVILSHQQGYKVFKQMQYNMNMNLNLIWAKFLSNNFEKARNIIIID